MLALVGGQGTVVTVEQSSESGVERPGIFRPGHTFSLVHGAFSTAAITPVAEAIAAVAMDVAPAVRAYPMLLDLFAQEYAIVLLLRRALDNRGVVDHNGDPRESQLKWISSHTRLAMQQLREMGLTRKVAAELQLDIAQAAQAAMGAARQAESVPGPVREFLAERGFPPAPGEVAS